MAQILPVIPATHARFAAEVLDGLSQPAQKTLPCKYLYDQVGTILFEAICALPEYGLTAADARLLERHAAEIIDPFAAGTWVAELGSGSGQKTRWILEALCKRQFTPYYPIEISALALKQCEAELGDLPGVELRPIEAEYLDGLHQLTRSRGRDPLLVLFLGSTLGNFDPAPALAFLSSVRQSLRPGDGLLLGLDLVKPVKSLRRAYDDATGITAAFNLNLLARINRELGADFELRHWRHRARYSRAFHRVEMHLESRRAQSVAISALGQSFLFAKGETIWTESSHKFRPAAAAAMAAATGFRLHRQWRDLIWPFSENLLLAQ